MKVKLSVIIEAIEMVSEVSEGYFDLQTGESVWLSDPLFCGETDEKLSALIENEASRFIRLPTQFDIHEYSIMEDFIDSLPQGTLQNRLARAIQGKGAFRRFKDELIRTRTEQQWFQYQAEAYRKIALRWCCNHDLEWEE